MFRLLSNLSIFFSKRRPLFRNTVLPPLPCHGTFVSERDTVETILYRYAVPSSPMIVPHICLLTACKHGTICLRSELLPNFQGTRVSLAFAVTTKCHFNQ